MIFDFDFPIFDEDYKIPLEKKILRHYYLREIGFETLGVWKLKLNDKLNEINKELKETKANIKELNRQSSSLSQIEEIEKIQLAIKEQEKKRKKIQREIFDIEEEIESRRDQLIEELKLAKVQKIEDLKLFMCEWEIK